MVTEEMSNGRLAVSSALSMGLANESPTIVIAVAPVRTRGSLTSPSYLVRNRTLGPPLENSPEIPPSSREEGRRLLHGLATNLATSLQTPDRKSTRLNSSHHSISYAVFCLKKKNNSFVNNPPTGDNPRRTSGFTCCTTT